MEEGGAGSGRRPEERDSDRLVMDDGRMAGGEVQQEVGYW